MERRKLTDGAMGDVDLTVWESGGGSSITLRDLLAIGFRRRRLVAITFLVIFLPLALVVLTRPTQYEAQMKILVKRERLDPLVTSEQSAQRPYWMGVTEEELNSEVELIKSHDLLAEVVAGAELLKDDGQGYLPDLGMLAWGRTETQPDVSGPAVGSAVRRLGSSLDIKPLRKSNVIQVNYSSPSPLQSESVLKTLAERYLAKHLAVHRPSGAFDFFERETERYGAQLELVQARLSEQNRKEGRVSVKEEKENALLRLKELEGIEDDAWMKIAETTERLTALEAQIAATPERTTTEITSGSVRLLEELHTSLVELEMKLLEMKRHFQSDYPPLQEMEARGVALRAAIAAAEQSPLREQKTDRNPAYEYLKTEVEKSRAELAGLKAAASATEKSLATLRDKARRLEEAGVVQQDLMREAAQVEESYLTYARKREEARIADALDAQRILNVAVAEVPTVLYESATPRRLLWLSIGALCAGLVSVLLACAVDYRDPSFRTPAEIEAYLGHPVIAAMPAIPARRWTLP